MPVKALPHGGSPLFPYSNDAHPAEPGAFAKVTGRMSGFYDLMLMLDPTAPEERRTAVLSETESMINSGGELVTNDDWGTRRMAYEIDHRPEAEYRLYQFNGDNTLLERLNQRLRITDAVLRFRIIKVKPGQPTPPPPDMQAPRRRDDREPQDTKVAARAAADAPAVDEALADAPPTDAPPADAAPVAVAEAPPAEAPPAEAPPGEAPPAEAPVEDPPPVEAPPADAPPPTEDA
jgi:small subunit ribosomal protein S6